MSAAVLAAGAFTSVGTSALQTLTSVRAGIVRMRTTAAHDAAAAPIVMGLVPDSHLPPLAESLAARGTLTARQARMLRLARGAWEDLVAEVPSARDVPLYLGVPESLPGRAPAVPPSFLADLAAQCPGAFDLARSELFAEGRAAAFTALHRALAALRDGTHARVWVGGVDTYLDLFVLATLDRDARLKTMRRMEGFRPGEGAAFVLLARDAAPGAMCDVVAAGLGLEPGHLGSDAPLLGDGLADAVRDALAPATRVRAALAGLNGEHLGAKEWGVAARRRHGRLAADLAVLHPAEFYGDPGAASGAILVALGALGLARGAFAGELLTWSASDGARRGAALLRGRTEEVSG